MPFVAEHAEHGRLDATVIDDDVWAREIHRRGVLLCCPECRARMVAAVSVTGLRYFRHHHRPGHCTLYGETAAHQALKREVLAAVRAVPGWQAEPEVPGPGWRADVLATGATGRRIAWEVQISGIGADTATERTARLAAADVEVCWLASTTRHSLRDLPHVLINQRVSGVDVIAHAERFEDKWDVARIALRAFVGGVCRGSVFWAATRPLARGGAWTTSAHLGRAQAAETLQRAARDERRERDERARLRRPVLPVEQRAPVCDDAAERVRRLVVWQQRVKRGWNASGDNPPPW